VASGTVMINDKDATSTSYVLGLTLKVAVGDSFDLYHAVCYD